MRILLISYDSYRYDGRLRELIKVAEELGEVTYITHGENETAVSDHHILYQGHGYSEFILFCMQQARRLGAMDMIFIDNRKGILPGYLVKLRPEQSMWCRTAENSMT